MGLLVRNWSPNQLPVLQIHRLLLYMCRGPSMTTSPLMESDLLCTDLLHLCRNSASLLRRTLHYKAGPSLSSYYRARRPGLYLRPSLISRAVIDQMRRRSMTAHTLKQATKDQCLPDHLLRTRARGKGSAMRTSLTPRNHWRKPSVGELTKVIAGSLEHPM